MKKLISLSAAVAISAILVAFVATRADAYCVYNDTDEYLGVYGETCMRCLDANISPHSRARCPGGESGCRGKTWITVRIPMPFSGKQNNFHYKHFGAQVTAHGWVRITGAGIELKGVVYNDDSKLIWSSPLLEGE